MYLKKAEIHLKLVDSGVIIYGQHIKVKPWTQYGILIDEGADNVHIENCLIERLTWKEWLRSLFRWRQ